MPGLHVRIVCKKNHWGFIRPALPFDVTGTAAWKAAQQSGVVSGLIRYRSDEDGDLGEAIAPSFSLAIPNGYNTKTAWEVLVGTADDVIEVPEPFGKDHLGLSYINSTDSDFVIRSTEAIIGANEGHSIVFFISRPDKENDFPVWTYRWFDWQFQILDGRAYIMRMKPGFTQTVEDALHLLLQIESPTSDDQTNIENYRQTLYSDYQEVNLGGEWYNKPNFLTFIPEERGAVTIDRNGEKIAVKHSGILATRQPGTVWGASDVMIRSNGSQAFHWQVGYPLFVPVSVLKTPLLKTAYFTDILSDLNFTGTQKQEPTGNTITLGYETVDSVHFRITATWNLTNTRKPAWLYAAHAYIPAGTRAEESEDPIYFDSDDLDDDPNPVMECTPTCDGEGKRLQLQATLRNVEGRTLSDHSGLHYEALENRLCDVWISHATTGTVKVMTNGIIKASTLSDMAQATPNQIPTTVTRPETRINLTICDQWSILDERKFTGQPVGDGLKLGAFLRECLIDAGMNDDDIAGISSTFGRRLPSAALGEPYAVRPQKGANIADFIRDVIRRYARGAVFYINGNGVWTLANRSNSVTQIASQNVGFSSSASRNSQSNYPGRWAILSSLDHVRDTSEFANRYRFTGGNDVDGNPIVQEWTIQESIQVTGGAGSLKYIGREIWFEDSDDGWRTRSDVQYALRSTLATMGEPPRYLNFKTWFEPNLLFKIGELFTVDTKLCRLAKINGGSVAEEESMQLCFRETGY